MNNRPFKVSYAHWEVSFICDQMPVERKVGRAMLQLLGKLVDRCRFSVRKDKNGTWQITVDGPLALAGFLLLAFLYLHGH